MTTAALYARVSSKRQAKDQTIGSQTAALRAHAAQTGSRCLRPVGTGSCQGVPGHPGKHGANMGTGRSRPPGK